MFDHLSGTPNGILLVLIGVITGLVTVAGGSFALRFRSSIALLSGLSGGALIGVALCDLLPEALDLGRDFYTLPDLTLAVAAGFTAYLALERTEAGLKARVQSRSTHLGPASLTLHSLMDGLGIGLAFHVSASIGLVVAGAVLAHDVIDGVNCVSVSLAGGAPLAMARRWLFADASAPLVGIGLAHLVTIPQPALAISLALFSGFLLYIGAGSLLRPSNDDKRSQLATAFTTVLGLALICSIVRLNGAQ